MTLKFYKKVLLPITVSASDYCWDHICICPSFDNEGGHPTCSLYLGNIKFDEEGKVPKPPRCLALEEEE
jgi:hypothetical protein